MVKRDWEQKLLDAEDLVEDTMAEMSDSIRIRNPEIFNGSYPAEQKLYAAVVYTTTSSSRKAAALWIKMFNLGDPFDKELVEKYACTLRRWKKDAPWWDEAVRATMGTITQKAIGKAAKIVQMSQDAVLDRLENGDEVILTKTGETVRRKVSAKDASVIGAIWTDKQQLLQGNPTSRVEHKSQEDNLSDLKKQFESFAKAKTIEGEVIK